MYVWVEDEYECAYCDRITKETGSVLTKYGWAHSFECSKHGMYYLIDSPMALRGQQIGPAAQ